MTKMKDNFTIEDILELIGNYLREEDVNKVRDAYSYSLPYYNADIIKRTLNIVAILTTVYADSETIIGTFLYQLFINDSVSRREMENNFNNEIVKLAYGVYKLNKITVSTDSDYLIEYYKRVIVGISEDVRVILIILSERVNLMRELAKNKDLDSKRIAKETLEIFAPIAHHLGIYKLKSELEDLSLRYLKPEVYYDIVEKLNSTKKERDSIINEMMEEITNLLTEHNIKFEIKGRSKSIYSIYNKLDKGRKFSDIYDLLALRILVESEQECYLVLGLLHSIFKPIPKRFKDFVAMPKKNGYQSLHTTVFGVSNELFEIQIRTYEMNEVAENGLAAHWSYKENKQAFNLSSMDQKLEFFKAVIDTNQGNILENAYNTIKEDDGENNIYVFTPKGDVIELPRGSTPIDFAYRVHSKIGDSMVGAMVNNSIVPLNYVLQDNDVVKINTSKSSSGPNRDWLDFVKLTQTKNKIKSFFTRTRKEELINLGRELLEKELKKRHFNKDDFFKEKNIKILCKELKLSDLESILINVGNNHFNPNYVINFIYPLINESKEKNDIIKPSSSLSELDINVSGLTDIKVNISSCCKPIPGDKIVGYITKNNGISIHRDNCVNLIHLDERIIDVNFNPVTKNKYQTCILIKTKDIHCKIGDILNKIITRNIFVESVNSIFIDNGLTYKLLLYVHNLENLEKLMNDIRKIRSIESVERE